VAIFDWYAISEHAGLPHNDDFVLAEPGYGVFLVADGMGGRPGGAQASRVAARAFMDYLRRVNPAAIASPAALRKAVSAANKAVHEIVRTDPRMAGMGTTLSAAVLPGTGGRIVHVGDSRIYRYRQGRLEQLTEDHTLEAEMLAHDMLPQAGEFAMRHVLSRAVGTQPTVEPHIAGLDLGGEDWLLLATDGFYNAIPAERMQDIAIVNAAASAHVLCRTLVRAALDAGPQDNVTLAVVRRLGRR